LNKVMIKEKAYQER